MNNKTDRIKVQCECCKKDLLKTEKQIKESKTNIFYCNAECRDKHNKIKSEKSKVEIICSYCKNHFYVTPYWKDKRKFCSRDCKALNDRLLKNTQVNCNYCENPFLKWNSKITEMNFCSHDCQRKWLSTVKYKDSRITKTCVVCNKEFSVKLADKDRLHSCSKECQNKHLHNRYLNNPSLRDIKRQDGLRGFLNKKVEDTLPEKIVRKYLMDNNINFECQKPMYDKFIVDFYLVDYDIVLEVYGDYWHSNPKIYGYDENKKEPNKKQIKQIKKDKSRKSYLTKCGHKFVCIWECDIYKDVETQIKQTINQNS